MSVDVLGFGTATPRFAIGQEEAAAIAATLVPGNDQFRQLLPRVYRQAGIQQRGTVVLQSQPDGLHSPQNFYQVAADEHDHGPSTAARMELYEEHAAQLALAASRLALDDADLSAAAITHLVTVSCSGFQAPGFDIALLQQLGLSPDTPRTHVGFMGCHGALNGLRVADAYAASHPEAAVLVCAVELCSLHHLYSWRRDHVVANALFADGAAATICGGKAYHEHSAARLVRSGSTVVPNTLHLMAWQIRDHGFEMTLSPEVPEVIERQLAPWLEGWLAAGGYSRQAIGGWAIHPGGPRILSASTAALGLAENATAVSQQVLAAHGNMSSPTILFILQEFCRRQLPFPWVALAFGPGLTIEAAVFDAAE
jgi:predicted naringenin-chalcone synthase